MSTLSNQMHITDVSTENLINIQVRDDLSSLTTAVSAMSNVIIRKGYSPYINTTTDTWYEYDEDSEGFINTGVQAGAASTIPLATISSSWQLISGHITEED